MKKIIRSISNGIIFDLFQEAKIGISSSIKGGDPLSGGYSETCSGASTPTLELEDQVWGIFFKGIVEFGVNLALKSGASIEAIQTNLILFLGDETPELSRTGMVWK